MKVTSTVSVLGTERVKIVCNPLRVRKRKAVETVESKSYSNKAERYASRVLEGSDNSFKGWLQSRPMDRYLVTKCN